MADITIIAIFLAGILSFLSPCVLPLLPAYLTYMAGFSIKSAARNKGKTIKGAVAFVCGFSCVFIALGAGASSVGFALRQYHGVLSVVAGVIIIFMGLHFLGVTRIVFLYRQWKPIKENNFSPFIMGLAFAFGWTPCIGPILGAVLAVAATKDTLVQGVGLLAIYSAGLGVPFIIAAIFTSPVIDFLARVKHRLVIVERVIGAFLVLTGIMFLTGTMEYLAYYLLETFPGFQQIG